MAEKLKAVGSKVNPLLLIQLPDARQGLADIKDEIIQILAKNHGVTIANGRLAVYLSEDKANLENITRNDDESEVMIFKQAIALGWDCPRAAILALFRDWRSFTFSIQTLGRILRMPELKHYADDELNTGYVFTNLSDFALQEDLTGDFLTIQHAHRREIYQPIVLRSVYAERHRELTRLSPQFIHDFIQAADELKLKDKVDIHVADARAALISDGIIEDIDKEFHISQKGGKGIYSADFVERVQTATEAQRALDQFVLDNLAPFAPESRSIDKVKQAIYRFLQYKFPMQFKYGDIKAQLVVLAGKNQQHFVDTINRAKEIYQAGVAQRERQLNKQENWEIPPAYNYNNRYVRREMSKSIFEPFYQAEDASKIEKDFALYLNALWGGVEWWFKNGEQDATFFAIPYEEDGEPKTFYVDWIVKFTDGRMGLFDTKTGITAKTAKARAEGLQKYIREENEKGKNLWGGIVTFKDGSWRYNDSGEYEYNERNLSGWKIL